ncbi:MAG TPA: S8 family serine peptidase [Candidatus Polarisedimenticolia bacterium]|nr:S8 family serine peptidase [Candidatus Polarisedimenticolia bacterium]
MRLVLIGGLFPIGSTFDPGDGTTLTQPQRVPPGIRPAFVAASPGPLLPAKDRRFDGILGQLARELRSATLSQRLVAGEPLPVESLSEPLQTAVAGGLLRLGASADVQVYVHVTDPAPLDLLAALGCRIQAQDLEHGIVQAMIPCAALEEAASLPGVRQITLPTYAFAEVGSKQTAGDLLLRASQTRADYLVDGAGVRIGVVSDGIFGLGAAIASGDLPATEFTRAGGKLIGTSGGVTAVSFRSDGDLEAGLGLAGSGVRGAEGVAMMEIIHDVAPGAQLMFANFETSVEFSEAVEYLAARADVVVDDISFLGAPYDGTSSMSSRAAAALNHPANPIRALFTSAGNRALDHYEETYVSSGVDGFQDTTFQGMFHQFAPTSKTTDALGLGPRPSNFIFLQRNQSILLFLTWDDPFGASSNDYDLYLFRNTTGARVAAGNAVQNGREDPLETIVFTNTGSSGFFDLRVQNYRDEASPRTLEIFILESPFRTLFSNDATLNYNTTAGSIPAMADAAEGVLSIGAINATDPGSDTIEGFSSRGPTNDGRMKPEVTSIDGVAVSGAGGFPTTFFGTSAAAPHAAAVAALLLQSAPCLLAENDATDPDAAAERGLLRDAILQHAIDIGPSGPDSTFGFGRNDALVPATAMLPIADTGGGAMTAECTSPDGALVLLDGSRSRAFSPSCPLAFRWTGPFAETDAPGPTVMLPLGEHEITLEVSQNGVTQVGTRQTITVRDTVAPVVAIAAEPGILWPPNHRLVSIETHATASDACDPHATMRLSAVTSNEPDDATGAGDGHTLGDIRGVEIGSADDTIELRAERDGRANGRLYTITYDAADASGNLSALSSVIRVPLQTPQLGPEPLVLDFSSSTGLRWDPVPGAIGYEVVRGVIDIASAVETADSMKLGQAICVSNGAATSATDAAAPPPGAGYFYLGQYDAGGGFTGFGTAGGMKDLQVTLSACH